MFKTNLPLYIFILSIHFCVSSQEKESVLNLVNKFENEIDKGRKLKLLDSVSKQISKLQSIDPVFYKKNYPKYSRKHIILAKELDSIDVASEKVLELAKFYFIQKQRPDSSQYYINNVLKDSNGIKKLMNLGQLYKVSADIDFQIGNLIDAKKSYRKAAEVYWRIKDSVALMKVISFAGHTNQRLGNLTDAILKYQETNKIAARLKDTAVMASIKLDVSYLFSQLVLYDEAFRERQEVDKLLLNQHNKNYAALFKINVMRYRDFVKQKKIEYGEKALFKALEYAKKDPNPLSVVDARIFLSVFYSKHKKQPEIAKKFIDTILLQDNLKKHPHGDILYWDAMSELEMARNRYNEAIPWLEKKLDIFLKTNDVQAQLDVEENLYKSYQKIINFPEANTHLERYMFLKDSVYNLTRSNSVIYYQTLYETEKRDSKIAVQEANILALEAKNEARLNLIIFGGIGLSLFFISLYLYRNRILLMRNKRMQQSFLQELLQTQERVSKRISKDLHDSVGQSLLLVKNRVLQNNDEKTSKVVDGVIDEVRAISRSLHPFKLEELGLTVTLQSSVEMIDENYDMFISAEIDNIDEVFDQEKEINIYRLVQESFNNILKHSNARSAEIKVVNKENDIEIIIKDNGKGFDVVKEKTSASKIGLKTLSERSKFLKANFKILSEINQGTTLIFNIPKYA